MSSSNPEDKLNPAEIEHLIRLEAIAHQGLEAHVQVGNALAEIRDRHLYRDSHPSFESYVRERWGVNIADRHLPSQALTTLADKPSDVLAKACEETLSALAGEAGMVIDIRLAVRRPGDPGRRADGRSLDRSGADYLVDDELLPMLRWLLSQASGTIGDVANQLENRASEVDDRARAQLRDDVLDLDDELAKVKALVVRFDWDAELERLLKNEIPPHEPDSSPEDDG